MKMVRLWPKFLPALRYQAESTITAEAEYLWGVAPRKLGLQTGVDVARGPEETSIYLTIGSPWM